MNFLRKMMLKWKLATLLLVPVLGLLWFAQIDLRNSHTLSSEAKKLTHLIELSVHASSLVHELQMERGATSIFFSSSGRKKIAEKLIEQRMLTDVTITQLNDWLIKFPVGNYEGRLKLTLGAALSSLSEIQAIRVLITKKNLSPKEAVEYYSGMNSKFLSIVELMSKESSVGSVNNASIAYASFLQSKEKAGLEGAVLGDTFEKYSFASGAYDKFLSLIATQDTYMKMFLSLATTEQIERYNNTMQGEFFEETRNMRQTAKENVDTGEFGIFPGQWLDAQSGKINQLKFFEDSLSTELLQKTQAIEAKTKAKMIVSAAITTVIFLLTILLGYLISSCLLMQINAALNIAEEIANGNFENKINEASNDETGQLLRSLNTMQSNLRESIDLERSVAAEIARIKQALDKVSGNVMIIDSDGYIIYMNEAISQAMKSTEFELRVELPEFDSSKLLGSRFEIFNKNAKTEQAVEQKHGSSMLEEIIESGPVDIQIGTRHLHIIANSIIATDGQRIGTVVEWVDRTGEINIEEEIHEIVDASFHGDLGRRINLDDKNGFFERLSKGVNELVDVSERVIKDTGSVLEAVSQGNLTQSIEADYQGSFGELKGYTNSTICKLIEIISRISISASTILSGSQEIAQGNLNFAQRTEEQASSLQETAAAMDEITETIQQNTSNTDDANKLAVSAQRQSEQGSQIVTEAVLAMNEISTSSKKIVEIIGVIDGISFQTNLLALNAAVEAARAGEQGRGFAVVATEVRNLAGRSAEAAKEIKELIEDSVAKVEEGSKLVNLSGEVLNKITESVGSVSTLIAEVTSASNEQSEGIGKVNKAIGEMDEMRQQNAALVEQAAVSTQTMGDQASGLSELISFFTISEDKIKNPSPAIEKLSSERPWRKSITQNSKHTNHQQPPKTRTGTDDSAWEEF